MRVHFQVIEGTRRRVQVFEGIVLKRQGAGVRETFTVRKQSFGFGVERTFPLHSPKIEKIDVVAIGDVNRAKLYYLRGRVGKKARVRERRYGAGSELPAAVEGALAETEEAPPNEAEEAGVEETGAEETDAEEWVAAETVEEAEAAIEAESRDDEPQAEEPAADEAAAAEGEAEPEPASAE